jgi:SAM-dependent methyltransferase
MPNDVYQTVSDLDAGAIQKIIDRLEFRGRDPIFTGMRDRYLDAMNIDACKRVLDLGCGTGVIARALAARPAFKGEIVAIDFSDALIEAGRKFAAEEGVADRIDFRTGDSHALGHDGALFDAVLLHTLVSHVTEPSATFAEAARVAAPGATIAIFDGDYASITLGAGDAEENGAMVAGIIATVVANPHVMRQAPTLLKQAGLTISGFLPEIYAEAGDGAFFPGMINAYTPMAIEAGNIDADRGADWARRQNEALADGTFFGSTSYYTYLARKPD